MRNKKLISNDRQLNRIMGQLAIFILEFVLPIDKFLQRWDNFVILKIITI